MPRTSVESKRSFTVPAVLLGLVPVLALASCDAPTADEQIEVKQSAATWDPTVRPIPHNFLTPQPNNKCCLTDPTKTGGNGDSANCVNTCATLPDGLATSDGVAKAEDYYVATGEATLDTLEGWKSWYGFPHRRAGETLDQYRSRTNVVVYYNLTELGLGRELGCSTGGTGDVGCYVTNYGAKFNDITTSLANAVLGQNARNTVVISYRPTSRDAGHRVQFAAFGADGNRLDKAQLDNQGARPIPQICMSCHGGTWNPDALANGKYGLAQDARFLPLMTNTVLFPATPAYQRAAQETAIMNVNNYAWVNRAETLTGRQQDFLNRAYDGTKSRLAFLFGKTAQATETPFGWTGKEAFYNNGVQPFCDTCHLARDSKHVTRTVAQTMDQSNRNAPDDTLSAAIEGGFGTFRSVMAASFAQNFMGVYGSGANLGTYFPDAWSGVPMPHSETAFARLWGDTSQTLQICTLNNNSAHPPIDCFLTELSIWPSVNQETHPLIPFESLARYDSACGQENATSNNGFSGTNSGRIDDQTDNFGVCVDGCRQWFAYCPGSEGNITQEYPGARMECQPTSGGYGTCVSCGDIGRPPCVQFGATCDTTMNPSCTTTLPCHEGASNGTICAATDVTVGRTPTKSTYEWKIDLGGVRRTKQITVTGTTAATMRGAMVETSLDNGQTWSTVPGGWFDSAGVGATATTTLTTSKPIELRYLHVITNGSLQALTISSVKIMGWTPINVGGGYLVCANSCVSSTGALKCGGNGCSSLPGGGAKCCQGSIRSAGKSCNGNPLANAPCVLP